MTHAAVGIRCPECARGARTRMRRPGFAMTSEPRLTYLLIGANVLLFVLTNRLGGGLGGGPFGLGGDLNSLGQRLALYGPAIAHGQYERLVTSAFIHIGPLHLALNMYMLYLLGGVLERYAGTFRFAAIYLVSALAGSFGALLLSPNAFTAGASGAIFGLMGALFVLERQRGIALLGGSIGGLILINLLFTFGVNGISKGGHLGGLAGGALAGLALSGFGRGHLAYGRLGPLPLLGVAAVGIGAVVGSLAVAG
jgi:membrane associated rhomboid family serine protease